MSDCPDCEKKVVEAEVKAEAAEEVKAEAAEEVKAEAAEEKAEEVKAEAAEEKAEEVKAEELPKAQSAALKVLKSIGRIVAATIIVGGILFLVFKQVVFRAYYENFESETVKQKIASMVEGGLGASDFTFTVTYFDEGKNAEGKKVNDNAPNGYRIAVKDKDGKDVDCFDMYAQYDTEKKELNVLFYENGQEGIWKSIIRKANVRKSAADAAPAAPVAEIKAAPAAN